jgi:Tol biopolymer transport system component
VAGTPASPIAIQPIAERWEVYVVNADGSGQRNLTRNPATDFTPIWSPDGRTIAFESDRDSDAEIYVMNADESRLRERALARLVFVSGRLTTMRPVLPTVLPN